MFFKSKPNLVGLVSAISFAILAGSCDHVQAQVFRNGPFGSGISIRGSFAPTAVPTIARPFGGTRTIVTPRPLFAPRAIVAPSFRPTLRPVGALNATRATTVAPVPPVVPFTPVPIAPVLAPVVSPVLAPASVQYSYSANPVTGFSFQSQVTAVPQQIVNQAAYVSPGMGVPTPIAPASATIPAPVAPQGFVIQTPTIAAPITSASPQPEQTGDVGTVLRSSANQLRQAIASMSEENAEVWSDFLAPDKIVAAIENEDVSALSELLKNYDGVAGNKDLTNVTSMSGFARTRQLMRQIVGPEEDDVVSDTVPTKGAAQPAKTTESSKAKVAEEEITELPAPLPEPETNSNTNDGPTLATPVKPAE